MNPHAIPQSDGDCPLVGENYERENAVDSTEEQAEPVTSGHRGHRAIPDEPHVATDPDGTVLFVDARSAAWRRRLGPLGWAALEHLALASRLDDQGWAAPIGVRAIATSIGVTKDTAARAITILAAAGLVTRESVTTPAGHRRSGYRLQLPEELELRTRPEQPDTSCRQQEAGCCPKSEDSRSCPTNRDKTPSAGGRPASAAKRPAHDQPQNDCPALRPPAAEKQASLFDPDMTVPVKTRNETVSRNSDGGHRLTKARCWPTAFTEV